MVVGHAKGLATRAQTLEDLRCAQAILLSALLNATLEQTAAEPGVRRASVGRHQAKVRSRLTHRHSGIRSGAGGVARRCRFKKSASSRRLGPNRLRMTACSSSRHCAPHWPSALAGL